MTQLQIFASAFWLQERSSLPWANRVSLFRYAMIHDPMFLKQQVPQDEASAFIPEIELALDRGVKFLLCTDVDFPKTLALLPEAPIILSYKGTWPKFLRPGLSVVGSRDPSSDSLEWMEKNITRFIQIQKAPLISGGANGVDKKAHLLSLALGNTNFNFQPSGLLRPYPQFWLFYEKEFLKLGGIMVSEFPPATTVAKHHFVRRNRLISGLGDAVLIIDAALRSGTYLTAKLAIEQHRPLFVLPGHPQSLRSQGSLQLICEGATMIRDAAELVQFFRAEIDHYAARQEI